MLSGLNVARNMLLRTTGNTRLLMLVLLEVFAPSHAFSPTAASAEALQASYKILELQIYVEVRFGFFTIIGPYYYHN
jgi:hypothetical protein